MQLYGGIEMKRRPWLGVGLTYVGTIIGAGFASGQEIWQFFSRHGDWGALGIGLAGTMFYFIGRSALERGRSGTPHFSAFLSNIYGRYGIILDYLTTLVLAVGIGVVAVGGGAVLTILIHWPRPLCSIMVLTAIIFSALKGSTLIVRINTLLVPYLLLLTLIIGLWPANIHRTAPQLISQGWWFSALLYVSYNLFTGMTTLLSLGSILDTPRDSLRAALLASSLLTLMALLEHRVLLTIGNAGSLPMMTAASSIGGPMHWLFGVSLLAAMYTTGIGEAFSLVSRYGRLRAQWIWLSGLMIGWPFQTLIASIYPVLGVLSVAFWAPLLVPTRKR